MTLQPSEQWATREDVREVSRNVLEQINQRFDDLMDRGDHRHAENQDRMRDIVNEAKIANGRLTRLEEKHSALFNEFQAIRKRWHDFRESIQLKLQGPQGPQGIQGIQGVSGENRHVTMRDVYRAMYPFVVLQVVGLFLCIWFPDIALWLPRLAGFID